MKNTLFKLELHGPIKKQIRHGEPDEEPVN